jgi:hypothetical protein
MVWDDLKTIFYYARKIREVCYKLRQKDRRNEGLELRSNISHSLFLVITCCHEHDHYSRYCLSSNVFPNPTFWNLDVSVIMWQRRKVPTQLSPLHIFISCGLSLD